MAKRVEIKIDQFDLTFQFNEQFSIFEKKEKNRELEHKHFFESVTLISNLIKNLRLEESFGKSQSRSGINFYNQVIAFGDYGNTSLILGYSSTKREMGVMIHFTASGLDRYISYRRETQTDYTAIDLAKEIQRLSIVSRGSVKFTRMDIACDFIGYGIKIDSIAKKVLKQEYIAQRDRLSKNGSVGTYTIDLQLDGAKPAYNAVAGVNGIETLYLGNRSGKGNFLRIYDKYKDSFVKGKLTSETVNQTDWVRYELEMKFSQEGQAQFNNFCRVDNQDYEKWLASEVLSRFRLVTKNGRDTTFSKELRRILNGYVHSRARLQQDEFKDLEVSKEHFKSGSSGFQALLFKINAIEGQEGIDKFIKELLIYQESEYEPSDSVLKYVDDYAVKTHSYGLADKEILDFVFDSLVDV